MLLYSKLQFVIFMYLMFLHSSNVRAAHNVWKVLLLLSTYLKMLFYFSILFYGYTARQEYVSILKTYHIAVCALKIFLVFFFPHEVQAMEPPARRAAIQ